MAEAKTARKRPKGEAKVQAHWISNTHWDREWRFSMQRTRYKLVHMMDMLLDIFEKKPAFAHFHLDSQTLPLQDYLEVRPGKEPALRGLVESGRLAVGPWFCLPDEYCVDGESLIRNLLLGHAIARRFGAVSKTGYSPFGWGQVSQMPQLYRGFGIDMMSFYRGTYPLPPGGSEYLWEGPDGTEILVSRLAPRPRYNVWYLVQRPAYWGFEDVGNRELAWEDVGGPFRLIDEANDPLDGQYLHPEFGYHPDLAARGAAEALREQDGRWTTRHRFWSCGHDSSVPNVREVRMLRDCDRALGDTAEVFHSTVAAWQDAVKAEADRSRLPRLTGEMRYPAAPVSSSDLIGMITSARMYIKQENFRAERDLFRYAEPLSVVGGLLGAGYPRELLGIALNWLLQNHGHDSIGGCSRDVVHDDMMYRFRQSREIAGCLIEQGMMELCRSIRFEGFTPEEMAVVVYNPAPFKRTESMPMVIDLPRQWKCDGFELRDEAGRRLPCQVNETESPMHPLYFNDHDVVNVVPSDRYRVIAELPGIPAMGYRTFRVVPTRVVSSETLLTEPKSMLTGPRSMENEHLAVAINGDGTLDVTDKATGRRYPRLAYFKDSSEVGDPWLHVAVEQDEVFTTLDARATVTLLRDGEVEAAFRIEIEWPLPQTSTADDKRRSPHNVPVQIVQIVTLRKGRPWVEVHTRIDNTAENHYLRVCFPTGIVADTVAVQGQFDVIERPVGEPDYTEYCEEPPPEHPMNSFVDSSDGEAGLAILNEGLKAYAAHDDPARTIELTLLRCFPLKICAMDKRTDYTRHDRGGQCPGPREFRYAVCPHPGDWQAAGVWQTAERFNLPLLPAQVGPTRHGSQPMTGSFLELTPRTLHVSALKRNEADTGWIVRLFNPLPRSVRARVRLNGGRQGQRASQSAVERAQYEYELPAARAARWKAVRELTLEERPARKRRMDAQGFVRLSVGRKKIVTLEFLNSAPP